jgi:SagB-type dehydrogenase family enzyme
MPGFLYKFFHNETSDLSEKGLVNIPKNPAEWPDSWKTIETKRYPLFSPISLPSPMKTPLRQVLERRNSANAEKFRDNKLSLEQIGTILWSGYGLQAPLTKSNRTVPSAGKLYPLEIYPIFFRPIASCASGIYHYGVVAHTLEIVARRNFSQEEIAAFAPKQHWLLKNAGGMFVISSVFERVTGKYGSRGYRYILLEAGHAAQNILLSSAEQGIAVVPVGGVEEEKIESAIGLERSRERVVYVLYF